MNANLGNQLLEPFDGAASTHPRVDRIATCANSIVLRLQVKAAVKVQGRAVFIKNGANPARASKHEIDLLRTRKESSSNCTCHDALWTLSFLPFELGKQRARLDRYSKDDLVLHHQARDGLPDHIWLCGKQAEKQGHELEDRPRDHLPPTAITARFAAKR